ncbi:SPOR domain-containing protein [Novosphingobium sp. 9U]|uniref:tetratricopeptide repeat protein n=1 Tax=Novosphingobium sp. 9U TaxID=2653158 RepID=UPI001F45399B|nr:SPOR domain-containing protein [Novosphingobium sp. 9U]
MAKLNRRVLSRTGMHSAMAAALAVGCVAAPGFALAGAIGSNVAGDQGQVSRKAEKQVVAAERAVAKQPQSAEGRARLGQTYLSAGRFVSASTSFEDAVSLGDKTPSTALGMALSYIGSNRNAEAVTLLGQWRDAIPVGDYALALALAGQPSQAVSLLSDVIKQGDNTPKNRQNLAYAFALDGHLPEARVIASQDVPLEQLDARISEWALQASVGSQQSRVAALIGAPLRSDPGQPAQLALAAPAAAPALAANDTPAPAAQELPPVGADAPVLAMAEPQPRTDAAAPEPVAADPAPVPALADASSAVRAFVSNPVVQDVAAPIPAPQRMARAERVALTPAAAKPKSAAPRRAAAPAAAGTHVVQLGSFTTEAGAHRAWGIFVRQDPSLKDRELRITQATVNGRQYWRVAAAGYDMASARSKCSSLRGGGKDCLAYATKRELPGALGAVAQRLARR